MTQPSTGRDTRIDFIRGIFIVMMAADHFGYLASLIGTHAKAKVFTYNSIGWSTGAEFFVFFSGYVIATVYSKTLAEQGFWKAQLRAGHRAWELYARNALVFMLATALVAGLCADTPSLLAATQIDKGLARPDGGITAFMAFQYAPTYLEVLPMYMALMLAAPAFLLLHARHATAAIAGSAAIWLAVQAWPALNFYRGEVAWNFNPFAWQFVFFLGMWFAKEKPLTSFSRRHRRTRLALCLAVLAACSLLKWLDKAGVALPLVGTLSIPWHAKPNVEPVRLLHFLLVIYIVGLLMPGNEVVRRFWISRQVAKVGTHSLDCFCLSILVGYATAAAFAAGARDTPAYFACVAVNIGALLLAANFFGWIKTPPWKSGRPRAAARPTAEPAVWAGHPGATLGPQA